MIVTKQKWIIRLCKKLGVLGLGVGLLFTTGCGDSDDSGELGDMIAGLINELDPEAFKSDVQEILDDDEVKNPDVSILEENLSTLIQSLPEEDQSPSSTGGAGLVESSSPKVINCIKNVFEIWGGTIQARAQNPDDTSSPAPELHKNLMEKLSPSLLDKVTSEGALDKAKAEQVVEGDDFKKEREESADKEALSEDEKQQKKRILTEIERGADMGGHLAKSLVESFKEIDVTCPDDPSSLDSNQKVQILSFVATQLHLLEVTGRVSLKEFVKKRHKQAKEKLDGDSGILSKEKNHIGAPPAPGEDGKIANQTATEVHVRRALKKFDEKVCKLVKDDSDDIGSLGEGVNSSMGKSFLCSVYRGAFISGLMSEIHEATSSADEIKNIEIAILRESVDGLDEDCIKMAEYCVGQLLGGLHKAGHKSKDKRKEKDGYKPGEVDYAKEIVQQFKNKGLDSEKMESVISVSVTVNIKLAMSKSHFENDDDKDLYVSKVMKQGFDALEDSYKKDKISNISFDKDKHKERGNKILEKTLSALDKVRPKDDSDGAKHKKRMEKALEAYGEGLCKPLGNKDIVEKSPDDAGEDCGELQADSFEVISNYIDKDSNMNDAQKDQYRKDFGKSVGTGVDKHMDESGDKYNKDKKNTKRNSKLETKGIKSKFDV